jgi:hypothetical protein
VLLSLTAHLSLRLRGPLFLCKFCAFAFFFSLSPLQDRHEKKKKTELKGSLRVGCRLFLDTWAKTAERGCVFSSRCRFFSLFSPVVFYRTFSQTNSKNYHYYYYYY